MFIEAPELKTHLYAEQIALIQREDETILTAALDAAVQEAKGYLAAFDRDAIFAAVGAARNALLLIFVKDIATWHFLVLSNAGTDLEFRETRYKRAVDWLKAVQKGDFSPDLPKAVDADGISTADAIVYGSNDKKIQHF